MRLATTACVFALAIGTSGLQISGSGDKVPVKGEWWNANVSLKGVAIDVPKDVQKGASWIQLKDEKYNKEGYDHWKPTAGGFLLKNKTGRQLECLMHGSEKSGKNMKVGFNCAKVGEKEKAGRTAALIEKASRFTPLMSQTLVPLHPKLIDTLADNERFAMNDINDANVEGEEDRNEKSESEELHYLIDKVDVGSKQPKHLKLTSREKMFKDVPYVDAQVDREVNQRMFEFFKNHYQYSHPEAHHAAARLWKFLIEQQAGNKHLFTSDSDEGTDGTTDLSSLPTELKRQLDAHGDDGLGGAGGADGAGGMWHGCNGGQVPVGWPDVPTLKCKSFAISPTGYWGCDWLQDDGTCGNIQFYPFVRWDGLDAYPVSGDHQDQGGDGGNGDFIAHAGEDYSSAI